MADMLSVAPAQYQSRPRTYQRDLAPTAVKPNNIAESMIRFSAADSGSFLGLANNDSLTITTVISSKVNPQITLGAIPFCMAIFHTSPDVTNSVFNNPNIYVSGPVAQPANMTPLETNGIPNFSDGHNLVYKTQIINRTGSAIDLFYFYQTRIFSSVGGNI